MSVQDFVPDVWYMIAGRIAPPLCCTRPAPVHQVFRKALYEVSKKEGDIDEAVRLLQDILSHAPPEWMVFDQAGQLLNVIGWRNSYHKEWFPPDRKVHSFKPGRCGPHVAHAYALMQAAADDEALILVSRIISEGEQDSDDVHMARLIRASICICQGRIDEGEEELRMLSSSEN
ncbi:hypothetical protein [Methanospirillum hungatei]|uniref:hypothetical protein n=1 Tax=Methanospirillum hungatei TaxID=2203 RepID=UPI0026EBDFC8|nr:hypothetical protein [Methanospirillum hungatei]MCA1916622.1 hypothetical protein [Methanospirillum hungatei]